MPTYTYPGVYIQEVNTGNKPIEGVSTSIVGFLGIAERGPISSTFITSYADFVRSFGTYYQYQIPGPPPQPAQAYLAYAIQGFFLNGGQQCWIARVASSTAVAATGKAGNTFIITAAGPGVSGNQLGFQILAASTTPKDPTTFRLEVYYWANATLAATLDPTKAFQIEVFDNLSVSAASSMYFVGVVNGGSNLVTVTQPAAPNNGNVAVTATTLLAGGTDGGALALGDFQGSAVNPANPTGLAALGALDDVSILCCPDESALPKGQIAPFLEAQCSNMMDRFAILQCSANEGVPSGVQPTVNSQLGYAAYYYPWLNVVNPTTDIDILVPPGGHIAGIYARSDNNENVAKDPANEPILGIDSLQLQIDNGTQGILNPIGVNCLRYFKGQGNLVWGGRTTSPDPDWIYINVRRLFIYVEKSIQQGTQWVVFEPNDTPTWNRVIRSVSDFLTGLWIQDMLQGATKDQAFFVRCDRTTMTQTDIDSGRLIVVIGIAPVKPAEFVIFQIGQWTGGSTVTES
jgi:phage tail sheath protein FI